MALDRRERSGELVEAILCAQEGHQATMWTALPAVVQSADLGKQTCVCQPTIKMQAQAPDGSSSWVTMPLLVDVPVQFPRGGGYVLTFPLKAGDEGLVVFASRCIDAWWQSGGVQVQAELRMHDLSDGFFLPGFSSVPNVTPAVASDGVVLRNVAGDAYVKIDDGKNITAETPSGLIATAGTATVRTTGGDLTVQASGNLNLSAGANIYLAGTLYINGKPYDAHAHINVTTGTGISGGVAP